MTITLDRNPSASQGAAASDAGAAVALQRRRDRYRALEWLRHHTVRAGGKWCMFSAGEYVTIGATAAGVAHVGGVKRCGSPHICPVCAPKVRERRAVEIDAAVTEWRKRGGEVLFVTATMQHAWGDNLFQLLDRLQNAWSRTWRFHKRPEWYGGMIRAIETTYGEAGWHPHVHAAIFVNAGHGVGPAKRAMAAQGTRWAESLGRLGAFADVTSARSPGWDVRGTFEGSGLSRYLSKVDGGWGVGLELTRFDVKRSRKGTTPFELLRFASYGDLESAALVLEYERHTMGKRAIVSSPGLMKSLNVEELSDEDAAAADPDDELVVEVVVPAKHWRQLLRQPDRLVQLLDDVVGLATGAVWANWPARWLHRSPALVT